MGGARGTWGKRLRHGLRRAVLAASLAGAATAAEIAIQPAVWPQLKSPVVDTGQDACYDAQGGLRCPPPGAAFAGQDGQIRGNTPRYRDNGDGTVSDLVTGLMWQKAFHQVRWADAERDARAARTGGHGDWRVPSIKELYSLILFSGSTGTASPNSNGAPRDARPYLDTRYFDFEYSPVGRFIDAQYISRTRVLSGVMRGRPAFFGVNFADGRIKGYGIEGNMSRPTFYVRYVRGNPDYGSNAFVDNRDGSISDQASGLMWSQADSGSPALARYRAGARRNDGLLDWQEALQFCQRLELAGHRDWRLPNAKELQSLVDYKRSPAGSGGPAIDPLFNTMSFINEAGRRDYPYYWSSTTHLDGPMAGSDAVYVAFGEALGYFRPPGDSQSGFVDVHGAGAQRGDPKAGDPSRLPLGQGPQGDVRRIYNAARCVRGAGVPFDNQNPAPARRSGPPPGGPGEFGGMPSGGRGEGPPQDGRGRPGGDAPNRPGMNRPEGGPPGMDGPGPQGGPEGRRMPPAEAVTACQGRRSGESCRFTTPFGQTMQGVCATPGGTLACVPPR